MEVTIILISLIRGLRIKDLRSQIMGEIKLGPNCKILPFQGP